MSKKTIKQRIALVAVSALTAGILSVASAPVANAAEMVDEESTGLLTAISGGNNETTRTAVLLSTGILRLSGNDGGAVKVSAGARITEGAGITGDQLCATGESAITSRISITPVGAAGSTFTVTEYTTDSCTDPGAITEVITVTIAATNLAGVANAGESTVRWDTNDSGAPDAATDAAAASTTTGLPLYLYMDLADAYGSPLAANGALIVTASSGAILGLIDTTGSSGTPSTASNLQVYTSAPTAVWVQIAELTAGAGWAGTVTVTHNGVAIATKSGKITGNPASIAITAEKIGTNAGTSTDAIGYQVKDASGNNVVVTNTGIAFDSSSNSAMLSAIAAGTDSNTTTGAGDLTPTCTQSSSFFGTANLVVKHTLANGTVIKSNSLPFTCGGNAESYTASWDKASYAQGDVAKLTVSFKDSKGGVANSYGLISDDPADQAVSASQMERVTGYVADQTPNSKGVVEYSFSVGTSVGVIPGKYNAVISYPTVNAIDGASNASASYEIASTGAVSNADVLKSIVSLIASINKQIRALQKLILKR
jgi:hypothetical protein